MCCPKCRDGGGEEKGWCIYCGHINYDEGVYLPWRSESDAAFLLKNFVEGTKWILYNHWGYKEETVTVIGDSFKGDRGRLAQKVVRQDGSIIEVELDNIAAKPVEKLP